MIDKKKNDKNSKKNKDKIKDDIKPLEEFIDVDKYDAFEPEAIEPEPIEDLN